MSAFDQLARAARRHWIASVIFVALATASAGASLAAAMNADHGDITLTITTPAERCAADLLAEYERWAQHPEVEEFPESCNDPRVTDADYEAAWNAAGGEVWVAAVVVGPDHTEE